MACCCTVALSTMAHPAGLLESRGHLDGRPWRSIGELEVRADGADLHRPVCTPSRRVRASPWGWGSVAT